MTGQRRRALEVRLRHINLTRDGRRILRGVNWTVAPGERWALIGANGAGKTQLLKLIAGDVWPSPSARARRDYRLGDDSVELREIRNDVAYVGAERQDKYERYGWNLTVEQVLATGVHASDLPLEPLTPAARRRVRGLIRRFALAKLRRRRMLTLSYGERRRVLIARAFAMRPRLLLLDEVFNGLDFEHRERLHAILDGLARSRVPWVVSAHRAEDLPRRATHWAELRLGKLHRLKRAPALAAPAKPRRHGVRTTAFRAGEARIELRDVSLYRDYRPVLANVDWTIRAGEQWGLIGANGVGKSTLLKLIYGDIAPALGGVIERHGHRPGEHIERFKQRVGWVSPELQSELALLASIEELVLSGIYASVGLNEPSTRADRRRTRACLERFDLTDFASKPPKSVSYGQLRRALIARALVHDPWLLLLDEPCTGLDPAGRRETLTLLERTAGEGVQIILATHHAEDLIPSIDRVARLGRGRLTVGQR
ncbi:MAG TPA: ATP-binding cassette domain-containing protein [Steroidobacteraceae bacterium]|nr:ATP-binding cassette domain-containing protein [Steroidobacteraceae bacterium]